MFSVFKSFAVRPPENEFTDKLSVSMLSISMSALAVLTVIYGINALCFGIFITIVLLGEVLKISPKLTIQ